jgi:histidine triad (HIT) family protein
VTAPPEGCLFCAIAAGTRPARIVAENEHAIGFWDINPVAPVHLLVIPRAHLADLREIDTGHVPVLASVIGLANELAHSHGLEERGFRLVANVGVDAGQSVHHLHFHLLGGRLLEWPPG